MNNPNQIPETPCKNCPEKTSQAQPVRKVINVTRPPLEFQWVAILPDGTQVTQSPYTSEEKYLKKDVDTKNLKRFALRNWEGQDMFGIDVEKRAFVLMGKYVRLDLPEGNYEVINIRRNPISPDPVTGEFRTTYILGLRSFKGKKQERYLYIYPGGVIEFSWRFK